MMKTEKMKVYILSYRGTIYGVFGAYDKALAYARKEFGCLEFHIMEKDVM